MAATQLRSIPPSLLIPPEKPHQPVPNRDPAVYGRELQRFMGDSGKVYDHLIDLIDEVLRVQANTLPNGIREGEDEND